MSRDDEKHLTLAEDGSTDLTDPLEVLDLLKDAILKRPVNPEEASQAVRQVLRNYEQQNRLFMIAAANAELPRVVRLLNFLTQCEEILFDKSRLENASTRELSRIYAMAQSNLVIGLDNIKKVADQRLDALRAAGGADGMERMFNMESEEELNALAGLPSLDSTSRDKVRKLMSGLADIMDKDNSVVDVEDDDESDLDT